MEQSEMIEWPNAITDKMRNAVKGHVASPKNITKPIQARLREAYGLLIVYADEKQLRERYNDEGDYFVGAINAYILAGCFLTSPTAALRTYYTTLKGAGKERRMGEEALLAHRNKDTAERLLSEDPSGVKLLESLKLLIADSYGGVDAAINRFKQLRNEFSYLAETNL